MRRARWCLRISCLLLLGWLLLTSVMSAQKTEGTISGSVHFGTTSATLVDDVLVQLITVAPDGTTTTQEARTQKGRFAFTAAADASLTHLLRAVHRNIQYFDPSPVRISVELPNAERKITVYETTNKLPKLHIEMTIVTVLALDRSNAQLTLARSDIITNPGDHTYTGDVAGITLRLPTPEAVIEASGQLIGAEGLPEAGRFTLDGGRLAMSAPLKPGQTLVVTRYFVGYDRDRDAYHLRITAPLPTGKIELRIPARFVSQLRPLGDAKLGDSTELEGEHVLIVELDGEARPGQSAVAELRGLAGRSAPNPLTERWGAALGSVLALMVLVGGFTLMRTISARHSADGGVR